MIIAIVFAYLAYKKAKDAGRSGIAWALIAAGVFIGTQMVVGMASGLFLGLGAQLWGWSQSAVDGYSIVATIVAIAVSIAAGWLVLRYLDRVPETERFTPPPPPPGSFGNNI